jgi:8-oxo-dGTP diphosphatase
MTEVKTTVTCAIIEKNNKILIAQRGAIMDHPFEWEFPGGKIKKGETARECMAREIMEELQVSIEILQQLSPVYHNYPGKTIELNPFICKIQSGVPKVTEHARLKWISPKEITAYRLLPADKPVFENYCRVKNNLGSVD